MIDILSLTDKDGKKIAKSNSTRDDKYMQSSNLTSLHFPDFTIEFEDTFKYKHSWGDDGGIDGELMGDEYFNVDKIASVKMTIGKKETRFSTGSYWGDNVGSEEAARESFNEHIVTEQDINRALRMAMAYKYMTEHIQEKLANGKSKEELMKMPYMDVVRLEWKKRGIINDYKDEIEMALRNHSTSTEDRAQKLLDETFGEGTVNLDEYIQSQVNTQLEKQEEISKRKAESIFSIENIKAGFAKLLTPVRLIQKKISDLAVKREYKRLVKQKVKSERSEAEQKARILEEQFNEIQ